MENSSKVASRWVVGMDLGDRWSQVCRLDWDKGAIQEESRLSMTAPSLQRYFSRLEPSRVILEAGTHSRRGFVVCWFLWAMR